MNIYTHTFIVQGNIYTLMQWLGRKKSQWANGPMLTQINGPFQISMGHGIKCMGHQWVSISKTCIGRKQDKHNINVIFWRQSSKLRMTPAFEASLVLNSLSLVAWASLLLCLVRMRFCWENTLSQLAVWRGSVRAICDSLMRSGSSSL